jgi:hypothetical protein
MIWMRVATHQIAARFKNASTDAMIFKMEFAT